MKRIGLPEDLFSLLENQFSGKTYFYTIGPCLELVADGAGRQADRDGVALPEVRGERPPLGELCAWGGLLSDQSSLL